MKVKEFLQNYFNVFCEQELENQKSWVESLYEWVKFFNELKREIVEIDEKKRWFIEKFQKNEYLKKEFALEDGIDERVILKILFNTQDNGMGNIGRGAGLVRVDEEVLNAVFEILEKNFEEVDYLDFVEKISVEGKSAHAAAHRFLRVLFYDKLTPLDPKEKHFELLNKLATLEDFERIFAVVDNPWSIGNKLKVESLLRDLIRDDCVMLEGFADSADKTMIEKVIEQIFFWIITEMFEKKEFQKTKIYYGSPGTGKTFRAKKEAKRILGNWKLRTFGNVDESGHIEVVQFHPSFSYEDFIEGIRPNKDGKFEVYDGVFRSFCKKAGEMEIELWKNETFKQNFSGKDFCEITYEKLQEVMGEELQNFKLNMVVASIPYEILSTLTLEEILPPYIFIIDEVNRAELSKVFGELMYALEYRGYNGKVKTQYTYLRDETNSFYFENENDYFFVPHNVYILGTMNTIDRSVDIFDFALRRRFAWEEVEVDYGVVEREFNDSQVVKGVKDLGQKLADALKHLNEKIANEPILGKDYAIGHAYVLQVKRCGLRFGSVSEIKEYLWERSLKPLLQEYLKGLMDKRELEEKLMEFERGWM